MTLSASSATARRSVCAAKRSLAALKQSQHVLGSLADKIRVPEQYVTAIETAQSGPLDEGSVGGGTGMNCYGFKGGLGTAS